jgi:drug/metabolite transporter (DMT)-like permease
MGIFFAVLSALFLASANVILKKGFKEFPPSVSFFIFSLFALILWIPTAFFLTVNFSQFWFVFVVGFISAILGQLIYIYVISKGELSITSTILATYSVYTIIFSNIFNHERLSLTNWIMIALTIVGTLIVCLPKQFKKEELKKLSFVLWAIIGAISIGTSDTLTKFAINKTSVGSFLLCAAIAQFIVSFAYLKKEKQPLHQFKEIITKRDEYKYAVIGSLLLAAGTMFFFLSFNFTLASIASPINATYPVLTVFLSLIFLKEKLTIKDIIGLLLVVIAVIGVSLTSN